MVKNLAVLARGRGVTTSLDSRRDFRNIFMDDDRVLGLRHEPLASLHKQRIRLQQILLRDI